VGHHRAGATMRRRLGFTFLHTVGLFALFISAAAPAAGYSPWTDQPSTAAVALVELAQRQDVCCKHCSKDQPCRNTCISAKARCKSPQGCAC
jgi:hypothetical protein